MHFFYDSIYAREYYLNIFSFLLVNKLKKIINININNIKSEYMKYLGCTRPNK